MSYEIKNRGRLTRLPQWAQDEFGHLERGLAEQAEKIQSLTLGPTDSNITVNPYSDYRTALDRNATVRFELDGGGYLEARFNGTTLRIHGSAPSLKDEFVVRPEVSNVVRINYAPEV